MARKAINRHPAITLCSVTLRAWYKNIMKLAKIVLSHICPKGNPASLYIICRLVIKGGLNWLLVVSRFTEKTEFIMVFSFTAYSAIASAPDVKSLGVGGR
jgi:hypothetical protein